MRNKKPFPDILKRTWPNWRLFKRDKRAQLRDAQHGTDELIIGSAYLPKEAYRLACRIRNDLQELRRLLSEKEWGR